MAFSQMIRDAQNRRLFVSCLGLHLRDPVHQSRPSQPPLRHAATSGDSDHCITDGLQELFAVAPAAGTLKAGSQALALLQIIDRAVRRAQRKIRPRKRG